MKIKKKGRKGREEKTRRAIIFYSTILIIALWSFVRNVSISELENGKVRAVVARRGIER
jgi:hypothetical protein